MYFTALPLIPRLSVCSNNASAAAGSVQMIKDADASTLTSSVDDAAAVVVHVRGISSIDAGVGEMGDGLTKVYQMYIVNPTARVVDKQTEYLSRIGM